MYIHNLYNILKTWDFALFGKGAGITLFLVALSNLAESSHKAMEISDIFQTLQTGIETLALGITLALGRCHRTFLAMGISRGRRNLGQPRDVKRSADLAAVTELDVNVV